MRKTHTWLLAIFGLWLALTLGLVNVIVVGLINSVAQEARQLVGPIEFALAALAVPVLLAGVLIAVLWRSKRSRGIELILGAVALLAASRLADVGVRLLDSSLHRMGDELMRSIPR